MPWRSRTSRACLCGFSRNEEDQKSVQWTVFLTNAALRVEVAALREENRRLKGLKGPPSLQPSRMDKETEPRPNSGSGARRRAAKNTRLAIDEDRILRAEAPAGSRFKSLPRTALGLDPGVRGL